jgi:hypothetical protein
VSTGPHRPFSPQPLLDDPQRDPSTRSRSEVRAEDRDIPSFEAAKIPRSLILLVPLLAAVVASPGLTSLPLSDDFALLYGNRDFSIAQLYRAFVQPSSSAAAGGTYRPLTEVSIGIDTLIYGGAPSGFHLVNLFFHAVNSLLCYIFVRALVPPRPVVALAAAVLFAVHPVHGDAIFWISGRSDLLCTTFYVLCLILFVRGRGPDRRRKPTLSSLFCFVLALLSKEVALSLPLLVIILDLAVPSTESYRHRFRKHLLSYLAYFGTALGYLGLRLLVLPEFARAKFPGLKEAGFNLLLYMKLLLLPIETRAGLRGGVVILLTVLTSVIIFLRFARMGDRRNLLLSFAWMVTILAPMLDVPRRWQLYLPSVGFCVFFAIVLAGLVFRRDREHPLWISRLFAFGLLGIVAGGAILLYYHAVVYSRAGELANRILAQIKRVEPLGGGQHLVVAANLPSVLTSWSGDQPVFAFGFLEALKLTYGRDDLRARLLSTLYVKDGEAATPGISRLADGSLRLTAGGGAYSFSFHTGYFTTGRDRPEEQKSLEFGSHITVIEEVKGKRISAIRVFPRTPLSEVLYWNGRIIRRLAID